MTSRTVIAHVMRRDFSRLSPGMPIREAVALLARKGTGSTCHRRALGPRRYSNGKGLLPTDA